MDKEACGPLYILTRLPKRRHDLKRIEGYRNQAWLTWCLYWARWI